MLRSLTAACVLALLVAGCGDTALGRTVPECGIPSRSISTTLILTAQSVPSAAYLPCIEALRPGWEFEHVAARSGKASFAVDSDRMGNDFLKVTLTESCDVGSAVSANSDEEETSLSVDVLEEKRDFVVVAIPVAQRHAGYASAVATLFSGEVIRGRSLVVVVDDGAGPKSEKVANAHAAGRPVIIVDDIEMDTATVSLRLPGKDEEPDVGYEEAISEIERLVENPVYKAVWFYEFPGGCIRYDINANGEGAQSTARDVARAIGMYPTEDLRRLARDAGYNVFEPPAG